MNELLKSRFAFGSSESLNSAIDNGLIDAYDILFLDGDTEPKVGWLDKNGILRMVKNKDQVIRVKELPVIDGDESVVYIYNNEGYIWDGRQCISLSKSDDLITLENQVAELEAQIDGKIDKNVAQSMFDVAGTAQTKVDTLANGQVKLNTEAIVAINNKSTGILAQSKIYADSKDESIVIAKTSGDNAQISANEAKNMANVVQTNVNNLEKRVGVVEGNIGAMGDLDTATKSDIVSAINEIRNAVSVGDVAAVVTIDSSTTTDGALKSYTIKQGRNIVGIIDIPKDMVVKSGEVVVNPEGQVKGTYIKLVLANVVNPLYINVGTLVDIYKAKASATQVQVAIDSSTHEISATIVAGSIGTTELANSSITTAKIADGNITKAKLSTVVQNSLDKADSAIQSVVEGSTNGTISVDGIDVTVHGLGTAAYTNANAYDIVGSASAVQDKLNEEVIRAKAAEEKLLIDANVYTNEQIENNVHIGTSEPDSPTTKFWINPNGETITGFVKYDELQTLDEEQKAQARSNIGAISQGEIIGKLEDLYDVTLIEEVVNIVYESPDFMRTFAIFVYLPEERTHDTYIYIYVKDIVPIEHELNPADNLIVPATIIKPTNAPRYVCMLHASMQPIFGYYGTSPVTYGSNNWQFLNKQYILRDLRGIKRITITTLNEAYAFPAGTRIRILGVK